MNTELIIKNAIIILTLVIASGLVTTMIDPSYNFVKLLGVLIFYYILMVTLSMLIPAGSYSKMIGSAFGLGVSILLWFKYGQVLAKK